MSPEAAGRRALPAPDPAAGDGGARQYCTFHVEELLVGVEAGLLQEVVRPQPLTPVPLAPSEVRGVVNLRGEILTAIDLRRHLGLAPLEDDATAMGAVVRVGDEVVSLLVDRPGEVVSPPPSSEVPLPPTTSERLRARLRGAYALADRLLVVLDPASLAAGRQAGGPA